MSMIHLRFFRNSKVEGRIPVKRIRAKTIDALSIAHVLRSQIFLSNSVDLLVCIASAKQMPFSLKLLIQNIQSREEAKDRRVQLSTVLENHKKCLVRHV